MLPDEVFATEVLLLDVLAATSQPMHRLSQYHAQHGTREDGALHDDDSTAKQCLHEFEALLRFDPSSKQAIVCTD